MALLESAQQAGTQVNGPYLMQGRLSSPCCVVCGPRRICMRDLSCDSLIPSNRFLLIQDGVVVWACREEAAMALGCTK